MRIRTNLMYVYWAGFLSLLAGALASTACIVVDANWCHLIIFDPIVGWIALLGAWLVLPTFTLQSGISLSAAWRYVAYLGYGLLLLRAVFLSVPRVLRGSPTGDFGKYYHGMLVLYEGGNPYTVQGSVTFPLPAFSIYHLASLGGRLSESESYLFFWIINLIATALFIWLTIKLCQASGVTLSILIPLLLLVNPWSAISHGQTTILAALGVILFLQMRWSEQRLEQMFGTLGLAFSVMLKPYLCLIVLGNLLEGVRSRKLKLSLQSLYAGFSIIVLMLISIAIPGGTDAVTFRQFSANFFRLGDPVGISQTAFSGGLYGNQSPVAAVIYGLQALADTEQAFSVIATVISGISILTLAYFTLSHRARESPIHMWNVASNVVWKVSYTHYTTWLAPSLAFLAKQLSPVRRAFLLLLLASLTFAIGWIGAAALIGLLVLSVSVQRRRPAAFKPAESQVVQTAS